MAVTSSLGEYGRQPESPPKSSRKQTAIGRLKEVHGNTDCRPMSKGELNSNLFAIRFLLSTKKQSARVRQI